MAEQGFSQDVNAVVGETVTETRAGVLAAGVGVAKYYNDSGRELTLKSVRLSVTVAPVTTPIVVDVNKNGVTMFAGAKPTIAAAGMTSKTVAPAALTLADGDYLSFDVDSVGTGTTGSNLTISAILT